VVPVIFPFNQSIKLSVINSNIWGRIFTLWAVPVVVQKAINPRSLGGCSFPRISIV